MQDTDTIVEQVEAAVDDAADDVTEAQPAAGGEIAVPDHRRTLAVRHVIERQMVANQELGTELLQAATDVTAAIVEAPAKVLDAVGGGATLPAAVSQTGADLREIVGEAGSRVRSAVGDYVSGRAVLPNAVIGGAAEVAGSVVRAQGTVAASALEAAFAVATTAVQGGDVRGAFGEEVSELTDTTRTAREAVNQVVSAARQAVREAATGDQAQ